MDLIIVSTTIRGDEGYRDWDQLAAKSKFTTVSFIVTGDLQSSPFDERGFLCHLEYIEAKDQNSFSCSESIGWKKYARRNIALLRALELQPDYILMIDDDNRPHSNYFNDWHRVLTTKTSKSVEWLSNQTNQWHNYLRTGNTEIKLYPRGFPVSYRDLEYETVIKECDPISPESIGLFQGISLGDPDIDAMTRIVYSKPTPLQEIKEKNYCLRNVWSPYNSQNTLFSKKLFPLAFMWPNAGRFEDIYGSLIWQQFLFNNNMYVHIGDAVNYQNRGIRDNLIDLSLEVEGYLHVHDVWNEIIQIKTDNPMTFISEMIKSDNPIISREKYFLQSYLSDLHRIGY